MPTVQDLTRLAESLSPSSRSYKEIFESSDASDAYKRVFEHLKYASGCSQGKPIANPEEMMEVQGRILEHQRELDYWLIGSLMRQLISAGAVPDLPEDFLRWAKTNKRT